MNGRLNKTNHHRKKPVKSGRDLLKVCDESSTPPVFHLFFGQSSHIPYKSLAVSKGIPIGYNPAIAKVMNNT